MRILVIGDIHGKDKSQAAVLGHIKAHNPDLVIVCGDITTFGPQSWAVDFLNSLPVKALAVPGNCDPPEVVAAIGKTKVINIHMAKAREGGLTFVGLGGAKEASHKTPLEIPEGEIYTILDGIMEKNAVLVLHGPAKGHVDISPQVGHMGSESVSRIVAKYSPRLVLSAHVHESRGIEKEGGTIFVNPGPAKDGYAALVTIDGSNISAELLG